jgi:hypothetical protein
MEDGAKSPFRIGRISYPRYRLRTAPWSEGISSAGLCWDRLDRRENQTRAWSKLRQAERTAASKMREALAVDDLVAHIRDPSTHEILTLQVWSSDNLQNLGVAKPPRTHLPLDSDFVSPDDPYLPGPWAQMNCHRRRVFTRPKRAPKCRQLEFSVTELTRLTS